MQPATSSHPGQTQLVWQEDARTLGIAWTNSVVHAEALLAAANHFDPESA